MKKDNKQPNNWQEKQFIDCVDLASLKKLIGLKKSEYKSQGKYPIFDQGQNCISGYSDNQSLVNNNYPAILFGDHTRTVKFIDQPFVVGADGTKVFQSKKENDPKFLYYSLLSLDIPNTGYNRHFKWVKEAKILLPPFPEQKKIAEILGGVDENIEKTEQIILKTEELKNGLMQKLLTKGIGHTKFKMTKLGEIPEEWWVVKIKDSSIKLIDGDRGVNYPKKDEFYNQGYCLFLSNKNIKNDKFIFDECIFITEERDKIMRKGKLEKGDIVLTTRGTVGGVAYYNDDVKFDHIRLNSGMLIFRHGKDFDPLFLYKLLASSQTKGKYKAMCSGSAQPQLPIRSLEDILLPQPKLPEQKQIAEILSAVDDKIYIYKQTKNKLTELKKGLMQDLLSGRVRV